MKYTVKNSNSLHNNKNHILSEVCSITVTYHPDLKQLENQLSALPDSCTKIIIDNGSNNETVLKIKNLIKSFNNIFFQNNNKNLGLARGINIGLNFANCLDKPPKYIILLDQDSIPKNNSIEMLLHEYFNLKLSGLNVACVGPLLIDEKTGLNHGFHQSTKFRWKRYYPKPGDTELVPCTNINGSGTFFPMKIFQELGGLDEFFFIDHLDTEWSFRLISKGYSLWGIPHAVFEHSMGESSLKFWFFGWKIWPVRSALRHQYLFRNAILLIKRDYVPNVWKFWAVIKLGITFIIVALFDQSRFNQIKSMLLGIKEGFQNDRK